MGAARQRGNPPGASLDLLAEAADTALGALLGEAPGTGAVYAGLHVGWDSDGRRIMARLLIVIRRFGPSTDPIELLTSLCQCLPGHPRFDERRAALVQFDETVVVKRAGLVEGDGGQPVLHHQYYFPLPGDEERLALLDFSSPTVGAAPRLDDMFESMAASFRFTGG